MSVERDFADKEMSKKIKYTKKTKNMLTKCDFWCKTLSNNKLFF